MESKVVRIACGCADQFNGLSDKKYNQKRFKGFILNIGNADQIDDDLIMGEKIDVS